MGEDKREKTERELTPEQLEKVAGGYFWQYGDATSGIIAHELTEPVKTSKPLDGLKKP